MSVPVLCCVRPIAQRVEVFGSAGVHLGRRADRGRRDAGDLRRHLRRVRHHRRPHLVPVVHPRRDELPVLQSLRDDVVEHRVVEHDVGARHHLQVDVGQLGELGAPHVGHDELGALLHRALDQRAEHRVRLGGVGARDEDDVARLLDLAHRPRGRRRAHGAAHRRHRARVAEPGAVIDVVRAERAAHHPHEEVVLLVGALGRGQRRDRVACSGRGCAAAPAR